eukprot:2606222-Prymnesium_polylepis.1
MSTRGPTISPVCTMYTSRPPLPEKLELPDFTTTLLLLRLHTHVGERGSRRIRDYTAQRAATCQPYR